MLPYRDFLAAGIAPLGKGLERIIFFIIYKVMRYRYAEVIQNLSRSFPEKSYSEIKQIAVRFYHHFSRLFPEILLMMTLRRKCIKRQLVLRNAALLQQYHEQHRNIIIMLGHYGNWECVTMLPEYFNFDIYGVFKPLHNRFFNKLMVGTRARFGLKMIPMEEAPRFMLQNSRKPGAYIFVADQAPGTGCKHIVSFLNQQTPVITGTERLARAIDAVVVYAVINRVPRTGRWEMSFSLITDNPGQQGLHEITQTFNNYLERDIRKQPAYWLWTHRRWKFHQ